MNNVQLHLALTHVPVILSITGLVMLVVSLLLRNKTLTRTSYVIMLIAAITTLPVYFTGEDAEEAVEHIAGVSESLIEEHEEVAESAMIAIVISGIAALAALFSEKWFSLTRFIKPAVLATAFIATALMFQTARLGGKIRHTEINGTAIIQNDGGGNTEQNGPGKENDDD